MSHVIRDWRVVSGYILIRGRHTPESYEVDPGRYGGYFTVREVA